MPPSIPTTGAASAQTGCSWMFRGSLRLLSPARLVQLPTRGLTKEYTDQLKTHKNLLCVFARKIQQCHEIHEQNRSSLYKCIEALPATWRILHQKYIFIIINSFCVGTASFQPCILQELFRVTSGRDRETSQLESTLIFDTHSHNALIIGC